MDNFLRIFPLAPCNAKWRPYPTAQSEYTKYTESTPTQGVRKRENGIDESEDSKECIKKQRKDSEPTSESAVSTKFLNTVGVQEDKSEEYEFESHENREIKNRSDIPELTDKQIGKLYNALKKCSNQNKNHSQRYSDEQRQVFLKIILLSMKSGESLYKSIDKMLQDESNPLHFLSDKTQDQIFGIVSSAQGTWINRDDGVKFSLAFKEAIGATMSPENVLLWKRSGRTKTH